MKKILLEDALILSAGKSVRFLVHHLPLRLTLFFGRRIGSLIYFTNKRRKVAYRNLRAAFAFEKSSAEMKKIAKLSFQNLVMSVVELLRFPDFDREYIDEHVKIMGMEKFKPSLAEGKGIIFLTAHFGNWEFLNATSGIIGYPMVALARTQKHPRSDEFLNNLRTSKGSQVVTKGMPIREILKALKNGEIVGMLSDQDGGKNGTFVRFFGRLSSTPSGVVTFALRTGALIFPVFDFRHDIDKHRVEVEGPLLLPDSSVSAEEAERQVLQQFAEILEQKIRQSPHQWLWGHRRWKSTPDRFVVILSDGKPGHLNQSLAVLETVKDHRKKQGFLPEQLHAKVITVQFRNPFLKKLFEGLCILMQGRLPFKSPLLKAILAKSCYEEIMKSYADIVISCGSSLSGVSLLVKHENQAKSIVVMKPPFSSKRFDLVIAPRHDKIKPAKNVVMTDKALTLLDETSSKKEAESLAKDFSLPDGRVKIGFLVGGDTEKGLYSRDAFKKILTGIEKYALEKKALILATSSRRTPLWADEMLKSSLAGESICPLLVIANEANREGVVGGILGLCDIAIVSGESISMISEAVNAGKPVVVYMPSEKNGMKSKHQEFLNGLIQKKFIVQATPDNIEEMMEHCFNGMNGRNAADLLHDKEELMEALKKVA